MNYLLQGRATSLDLLFQFPFLSTLVLMQFVLPRPVFFLSFPSAGFAFPEVLPFSKSSCSLRFSSPPTTH